MLSIRDLKKSYAQKTALKGLSLDLPQGEIVGLFGENGAGKTTLLKCILGFLPYRGEILLDGEKIGTKNIHRIAFATSEHSFFPDLSPAAHRDFYQEHFPRFSRKRFSGLMDFFALPMHKAPRSFSTGQKNQFELILALSQGADYILMDEPFAGNDLFNREDFYKLLLGMLREEESILLSTHLVEEVSGFVDRAILLHEGELLSDLRREELEEQGLSLVDYVKTSYRYQKDRVSRALTQLSEDGEGS